MSTAAPRTRQFDAFLAEILEEPETRAAYEDSQSRHRVIDALVRFRNRLNATQTDVARRMGVKQPSVSQFETEGSDPRLSSLQRYARAVDASIWVNVVPDASHCARVDFYDHPYDEKYVGHAERKNVTERAEVWAGAGAGRYRRHLSLVTGGTPPSVPVGVPA